MTKREGEEARERDGELNVSEREMETYRKREL